MPSPGRMARSSTLANLLAGWKARAKALKTEIHALMIASRDPRTPWTAKMLAVFVLAYAFSPIDLIPDFIPVLGYLDDLILLPLGIALVIRLIPDNVMDEARQTATQADERTPAWVGAVLIVLIWLIALTALIALAILLYQRLFS